MENTLTKTLESIMNFERGQVVKYNPDNHGFRKPKAFENVRGRIAKVIHVEQKGDVNSSGQFVYGRTGRITVLWEGDSLTRIVNYKNLVILN